MTASFVNFFMESVMATKAAKKKREYLVATTKTDFVKKMKETVKSVALTNDQAKELYDVFTAILKDTVISEKRLSLNGVGTFKVNERKARKGINPKTRQEIKIPATKTVSFKPTPVFKKEL